MKKIQTIAINKQQSYVLTLQAMFLFFLGSAIFTASTGTNDLSSVGWLGGLLTFVVSIFVHEMLHGVGFVFGGIKPKFGIGLAGIMPVAYATAGNKKLPIPIMLFTAYLPLVVLSVLFIIIAQQYPQYQSYAMIGFLANFTGAVGDLWLASKLWKYLRFKNVSAVDTKSGIVIYSKDPKAVDIGKKATSKEQQRSDFGKLWAVNVLILTFIQFFLPVIFSSVGFTGNFRLGFNEIFYIFEMNNSTSGRSASINLFSPIIIGLVITIVASTLNKKDTK